MKKLMFIVATVFAVGITQAASLDWKVQNFRAPVAPANLTIGSGNSKVLTSDTAYTLNLYLIPGGSGTEELVLANITLDSDAAVTQTRLWDQTSAVSMRDTKGDASGNVYLVLKATYEDAGYDYSIALNQTVNLSNIESAADVVAFNFNKQTWTATAKSGGGDIPEPTSGLLLALGGAMLALRRRR